MKKILITTSSFDLKNFPLAKDLFTAGYDVVLNPYKRRLNELELISLMDNDVVGLIAGVEPITEAVFGHARELRVVSRCGVGLDNVDLAAARAAGVRVCNTPDAPVVPVAELTVALMLNLLRHVTQTDRQIRQGNWSPAMGSLLSGKTVGIAGLGRIGSKVAELLHAFDAKILAFDPNLVKSRPYITQVTFDQLLCESDLITLHMPLTPETRHIISKSEFSRIKNTALVFNLSRGGLIEEGDLFEAITSGQIAGAGLDVFESEPYDGPLATLENVLLTAHMGSYAVESRRNQERESAENLVFVLRELQLIG
jgi:D-3-phosphoglycerate dehydrogenase